MPVKNSNSVDTCIITELSRQDALAVIAVLRESYAKQDFYARTPLESRKSLYSIWLSTVVAPSPEIRDKIQEEALEVLQPKEVELEDIPANTEMVKQ